MKSSILLLITIVLSAFSVDAVNQNTNSKQVCKISPLDDADGTQNPNGSCVQTALGEVPNTNNMVATMIVFPPNGAVLKAKQTFTIRTKTVNLAAGFFSDPAVQYNTLPQTLAKNGQIQGHSHVTVQKANEILNAKKFEFFKGLNDPANAKGELTTVVEGGLKVGQYRLCTMVSSFTHQPVVMPIAQRGAQDDCVRFAVGNIKKRGLKKRYAN